jgi:glycosyltransferase involved in cell wall biosynthesis
MATYGRDKEVAAFCLSLKNQTYHDFELIIVDQNQSDMLAPVVREYSQYFIISHIKSEKTGLSYNRNIGLAHARGDIIAFPDDDCEYKPDTLDFIKTKFCGTKFDFVSCNSKDYTRENHCHFSNKAHIVSKGNFFISGISYTIFIKSYCLKDFTFDVQLGCGAIYGSGEESDLLLYLIYNKFNGIFYGNYAIHHPYKPLFSNTKRAYEYSLGYGALFKKAVIQYRFYSLLLKFAGAVIKNIIGLFYIKRSIYYSRVLHGKITGFIKYKNNQHDYKT